MILHGDSLDILKTLDADSVDAVVTDPPYGWRFMGKAWDAPDIAEMTKKRIHTRAAGKPSIDGSIRKPREKAPEAAGTYDVSKQGNWNFMIWTQDWATEMLRVLKPGGFMLVFCGPRTYHAMAMGVEQAGFEIRDQLQWIFGSGFPKSHNMPGGLGTALKPANEPIVLARKPLSEKTVAKNILKHGTGGLNIDASRIGEGGHHGGRTGAGNSSSYDLGKEYVKQPNQIYAQGRWPSNLILDESAAEMLDEQSGALTKQGSRKLKDCPSEMFAGGSKDSTFYGDSGGASRFFYVAKASKRERNAGLEGMPEVTTDDGRNKSIDNAYQRGETERKNHHPTVKPIKLMEYLCRLITPPGGTVLDPFAGSGSTGVAATRLGFKFIGIERELEYCAIAEKRIANELKTETNHQEEMAL